VRSDPRSTDPDLVARFRQHETPAVSDLMNRLYTASSAISCLTPDAPQLVGPACTVKVFPGDNLMVHAALDVARPGDVVVIDAGGASPTAVLGDLVATKARHRGIAGFVVDGLVRDLPGILALADMPVFARGVTPIGPLHRGPGEIGFPVCLGGIVVHPGDVVVADLNGIAVVPLDDAQDVLRRLEQKSSREAQYVAAVARGEFSNAWVTDALRGLGVGDPPA
jgi:RraA family protein